MNNIRVFRLILFLVIIMLILGVLYSLIQDGISLNKLNNVYKDIDILEDRISMYYLDNGDIPIKGDKLEFTKSINPNDNKEFYEIDLEKLENLILNYGKKENGSDDIYIINNKSHTIYYQKGVVYKNNVYHTRNLDYQKVEI